MTRFLIALTLVLSASTLSSTALAVDASCANTDALDGHKAMVAAHHAGKYDDFQAQFQALCVKQSSFVTCATDKVERAKSDERMKSIVVGDKCAEAFKVPGGKEALIFLMTTYVAK